MPHFSPRRLTWCKHVSVLGRRIRCRFQQRPRLVNTDRTEPEQSRHSRQIVGEPPEFVCGQAADWTPHRRIGPLTFTCQQHGHSVTLPSTPRSSSRGPETALSQGRESCRPFLLDVTCACHKPGADPGSSFRSARNTPFSPVKPMPSVPFAALSVIHHTYIHVDFHCLFVNIATSDRRASGRLPDPTLARLDVFFFFILKTGRP